ncbi:uncharacterized protein LOC119178223 [Rhipicephalus microplus]|uniref:uncharacterized protein LOC119178223 n=1 Tax=Rhipicephalus microplus TaxID=6941 RepID=UPI003F6C13C2
MGHVLTKKEMRLYPSRVEDIMRLPPPQNHKQLESIPNETNKDAAMAELPTYASTEWPKTKDQLYDAQRNYWCYRDELHVEDGLLLRSNKIVIPPVKRREVLRLLHAARAEKKK